MGKKRNGFLSFLGVILTEIHLYPKTPILWERNDVMPGGCFKLLQKTKGKEGEMYFLKLANVDNKKQSE